MRTLLPPALVALLLSMMIGLVWLLPGPALLPGGWRLVGLPFVVAGLALTIGGSRVFDRVGTNIKTFDDPDVLVTDGVFSYTRNPMYLGFALFLGGVAALLGAVSPWLGPAAFIAAADRWYIPFEERRMAAVFGVAYGDYRRMVRRWLGRSGVSV